MSESDRKRGRDAFERVQRFGGNPEGVFRAATENASVDAAADFEDGWIDAADEADQERVDIRGY